MQVSRFQTWGCQNISMETLLKLLKLYEDDPSPSGVITGLTNILQSFMSNGDQAVTFLNTKVKTKSGFCITSPVCMSYDKAYNYSCAYNYNSTTV